MREGRGPAPIPRAVSIGDRLHGSLVTKADLETLAGKLFFDLEPGSDAYVRFAVLLVLSVLIATGGVVGDSTATVIGAMIVAPLMTPIMATAFAIVSADLRHIGRSLALVALGVAVAVGLSYVFGVVSLRVVDAAVNGQVSSRISPSTVDLIVALASGAAGAFALSRENVSDALPGVAIAISLVPPLCVVGVMLANHDPSASAGAFLLFLTNLLAILVAGGGVLAIMGYGRAAVGARPVKHRRRSAVVIGVCTVAVLIPLTITSVTAGRQSAIEYGARNTTQDRLAGTGLTLGALKVTSGDLGLTVLGASDAQDAATIRELASALHARFPNVDIRIDAVQGSLVEVAATAPSD